MTKAECQQLVERMWASWGSRPENPEERKQVYRAWFEVVGNLLADDAERALTELVILDGYKPRPGSVLRRSILGTNHAPGRAEAWGQVQAMRSAIMTGNHAEQLHPLVVATLEVVGSVDTLNTGSDRDFFCSAYDEVVAKWEAEQIAP
jgi:hypothetical protein